MASLSETGPVDESTGEDQHLGPVANTPEVAVVDAEGDEVEVILDALVEDLAGGEEVEDSGGSVDDVSDTAPSEHVTAMSKIPTLINPSSFTAGR